MKIYIALCVTIQICIFCRADLPLSDIVNTTSGEVQGVINTTIYQDKYSSFKGIPYGESPRKFQAPVPKAHSNQVIQCFKEGNNCLQVDSNTGKLKGSVDCLFLNVYTPYINLSQPIKELKPVLFWVHGGTFITGSGDSIQLGPDGLIHEDLVVVTINYRLGGLGFLLTKDTAVPGDAGLKDQLLALNWVNQNIHKFGGDPKKITLGGQSAGSVSMTAQDLSNKAAGLIDKQILFSGTICNFWGYNTRAEAQIFAYSFANLLNNNTVVRSNEELLRILNDASPDLITLKSYEVTTTFPVFKPGLDLSSPNNTVFLNNCYYSKYASGNYSIVPTMMGFTKDEALRFTKSINDLIESFRDYMNQLGKSDTFLLPLISETIGQDVADIADLSVEVLIDLFSEVFFQVGIDLCQRQMCAHRNAEIAPIYYYLFAFDAKQYSFHYQAIGITEFDGVGHEDELQYIWQNSDLIYPEDPDAPVNVVKRKMTTMVTNFVKYGNPTPKPNDPVLNNVTWPNSCNDGHYLLIDEQLSAQYSRPTGKLAEALIPVAEIKLPIQSDCFETNPIVDKLSV